ncbi:uncharacterized protein LOC17881709 [Capsella rubella]|uniref:uncharacterized protein LOC17881709 n=1 Tax=Capsella rubella TaxID=81985 RepID=UPI000CD54276|nr:uncharacterized protein LOC17881709 [Capsella rubella]
MERQAALRKFLFIAIFVCAFYNGVYGRRASHQEINMKLKTLNKPASKTIKSEDGDIIDCVDIYKQPAFDHPALRNHKIQMKPSVEFVSKKTNSPTDGSSKPITSQTWSKSGGCPVGTVPIRRVSKEDLRRASSLSQFGRKTPQVYDFRDKANQLKANNINGTAEKSYNPRPKNRSEAILIATGNYLGAQSDINTWNPQGVQCSDYSSAQIWLLAGYPEISESIEAGWMVNPAVFGDTRTRLFTYWTNDAYSKTGCINLLCSGFVQISTKVALGATIDPVSSISSTQYHMSISINLDPDSGNWWLTYNEFVLGYWPGTLFQDLRQNATTVQWGGEVYSPNVRMKPHTKTPMGSGDWAYNLYGKACFHTNIRIKDNSWQVKFPKVLVEFSDEKECYSTLLNRKMDKSEPMFYFGGPGQNPRCP